VAFVCELVLRLLMTPYGGRAYTWGVERRQLTEGFARATFSFDGRRLTGNGELKDAPNVLLLGDSHVEGLQVNDSDTMGSVLERLLRSSVGPANVVAYGFGGAAAPQFCSIAEQTLARWHPARVIVYLDSRNIGSSVLSGPVRFITTADGRLLLARSPGTHKSLVPSLLSALAKRSSLVYLAWERWKAMPSLLPSPSSKTSASKGLDPPFAYTAFLSVKALQDSYGSRLLIAYDPMDRSKSENSLLEREFLKACHQLQANCIDVADTLAKEPMPRGFSNTAPNTGHYNAAGHRRLAEILGATLTEQWNRN